MHSAGITVADSHFHQKIIDRYQKGKGILFRSPLLMFLKNKRRISFLKINVDVSVNIFNKIGKIFAGTSENVQAKKSQFSRIKIENIIQHYIFRRYPLEGDQTDKISFFQYYEKERMQNTGHVWFTNKQTVQLKLNNRTQSSFYSDAIYRVLQKVEDQPISWHIRLIYGLYNIQSYTYHTGHQFTKIKSIQDKRDVPSSIIRNINKLVINGIQFNSSLYPEAVYKVLLQDEDKPISQYLKSKYGSQNIIRFLYNTGHRFKKIKSIQDKRDVPSPIIKNINKLVINGTQFNSSLYPEAVYKVLLQDEDKPISQYLKPEFGSQSIQRFPYNTGHQFTKIKSIQDKKDVAFKDVSFSIIRNVHRLVNNGTHFSSAFYPEAVYKVLLQDEDKPISQYLKPEYGSQNIQLFPYNTGHHFTKIKSIQDKRGVTSSIIRNIHRLVNNRTQFISSFYPEAVYTVFLQGSEQTFENHRYSEPSGIFSFPERPSIGTAGELLYFNGQRNIEQEIEEVKKIAIDAREALRERSASIHPSGDTDLKKHLDVHRLSDQVYQNIEQRIRIEKERRGL